MHGFMRRIISRQVSLDIAILCLFVYFLFHTVQISLKYDPGKLLENHGDEENQKQRADKMFIL